MDALLDTTVIIHLLRRYPPALTWLNNMLVYGIASITWMEVMEGTTNKANQAQASRILDQFELVSLTLTDQQWAMQQLERFQFSHHIRKEDCLIASVSYRLQVPLYTHNLKDIKPLVGSFAVQPYV